MKLQNTRRQRLIVAALLDQRNSDPGDVRRARDAEFEQRLFGLRLSEMMFPNHRRDDIGDFCVANYLPKLNMMHWN